MNMLLERVIQEIRNERLLQDQKWGGPAFDDTQPVGYFLEYIDKKLCRNAAIGLFEENLVEARHRLIQIAALAIAAVETLDRRGLNEDQ